MLNYGTLDTLHKVIFSSLHISKVTSGLPCSRAQSIGSDFLTKNTFAALSIWNIINPKNLDDFEIYNDSKVYDFPSAFVLVRTLFEGYINMNYLLIDPESEEVREFRLDVWDRHDLLERQKMGSSFGSRHKKLEEEKKHIKSLAEKIKTSRYFRNLSPRNQKLFLNKGRWTNLSVIKIADKANIHRTHSEYIYKFLSNYSHCEAFALMQIHSINSPQDSKKFMKSVIGYTEMFLSQTLKLFRELGFNDKSAIKFDDELYDIIDYWEEFLSKDSKDLMKS